jgi:DNA-binding transcriptional ArsR family regulator
MRSPGASAPLFAALGDETRLRIVTQLTAGPRSIARLTEGSDVTRQAITKHLRVLEDVGLVHAKKHGRETMWTLEAKRLDDARLYLDQISAQWDRALERLKNLVEE